jgi:hypothetical protein
MIAINIGNKMNIQMIFIKDLMNIIQKYQGECIYSKLPNFVDTVHLFICIKIQFLNKQKVNCLIKKAFN